MPTRAEQRRDLELMLAKGRARRELREEKKQQDLQNVNRPSPNPNRPPDDYQIAASRFYEQQSFLEAIDAQHQEEMDAISRHYALRRRHLRSMAKIREILGDEVYFAARAEARRRRGQK